MGANFAYSQDDEGGWRFVGTGPCFRNLTGNDTLEIGPPYHFHSTSYGQGFFWFIALFYRHP